MGKPDLITGCRQARIQAIQEPCRQVSTPRERSANRRYNPMRVGDDRHKRAQTRLNTCLATSSAKRLEKRSPKKKRRAKRGEKEVRMQVKLSRYPCIEQFCPEPDRCSGLPVCHCRREASPVWNFEEYNY